jgi:hypothetical protein
MMRIPKESRLKPAANRSTPKVQPKGKPPLPAPYKIAPDAAISPAFNVGRALLKSYLSAA